MIIAQFQFPVLFVHPVRGVEQVTLPYYERVVCSDYEINTTEKDKNVVLHGAYRGEATIIFRLKHVETFSFFDEESNVLLEKWKRYYLDEESNVLLEKWKHYYLTDGKFIWVHDPMLICEKEMLYVNDRSDRCSQPD